MSRAIPAERLRRLRNDLPMAAAIAALGRDGPPSNMRDGRFCFLCPHSSEMLAHVNPRTNLTHCFARDRNLNTIDLLRLLGYDFRTAVALLERWLAEYELRHPRRTPSERIEVSSRRASVAASPCRKRILQNSRQFGNRPV